MILAADIGGTKLLFGWFEVCDNRLILQFQKRYPSGQFQSLEDAIDAFLKDLPQQKASGGVAAACFSVAGPVVEGNCYLTNLGWQVEEKKLTEKYRKFKKIIIRNDLEALGVGILALKEKDLLPITPYLSRPSGKEGNRFGVLAPGTGLGEALILDGKVYSSEGAHCEFGPRNREEAKLWNFLHEQFDHVSYEPILSGEGLCRLVRFLMVERGVENLGFPLVPEEVTKRGKDGSSQICGRAIELFAGILGAEAGNLALKIMTLGGIYLGGNIIHEILPWLKDGYFLDGFLNKGRFSYLMETIPVYVILDSHTAFYGSGLMAAYEAGFHGPLQLETYETAERG